MITIVRNENGNDRQNDGVISITGKSSHIYIIIQIRSPLGNKETLKTFLEAFGIRQ